MICEIDEIRGEVILSNVTLNDILSFLKVWLGRNKQEIVFGRPKGVWR